MNRRTHKFRRTVTSFALAASVAAVAVPAAAAVGPGSPGVIPSKLGSPDPRVSVQQGQLSSRLTVNTFAGSVREHGAAGYGNVQMASDESSQPSLVARQLGSQDSRDTAADSLPQSSIIASDLGSPDVRDAVESTQPTTNPSTDGFGWGKGGIEIAVAVCGLLLLIALGFGTRRLHHGGHRLGSA
jgi:hypothetical protein